MNILCPVSKSLTPAESLGTGFGCNEYGHDHEVRVCHDCDIGVTYPLLENLETLYQDRTSNDFQSDDGTLAAHLKAWVYQKRVQKILKKLDFAPQTILDIGCGDGRLAAQFSHQLLDAQVTGMDFHTSAPAALLNGRAKYCPLSQASDFRGKCDLIVMSHVLEHSNDPVQSLKDYSELLCERGIMYVEVPNRRCVLTQIFGKCCESWYIPYHRVHFSRLSLRKTVDIAGLTLKTEGSEEMPIVGRSLQRVLNIRYNTLLFATGILLHPVQILLGKVSQEPCCLTVTLSKKQGG